MFRLETSIFFFLNKRNNSFFGKMSKMCKLDAYKNLSDIFLSDTKKGW